MGMAKAAPKLFPFAILAALALAAASPRAVLRAQTASPSNRVIGTVSSVSGNTVSVKTDADGSVNVTVPDTAKILRTAPGQKTLAGATKITVSDIGRGDRVLMAVEGNPPSATIVVVNKKSDIDAKQAEEQADWQQRGVGGLVKSVDAAGGTLTITSGARTITIHATPATAIRRYAPDSVRFSDARPSTLAAIQPGDQVTARGNRNPGDTEVTADEIVSGSFRNIAGIVTSTDAAASTFTVKDLLSKKTVTIRVTPDSDLRKLNPQMAEMIAMRLKAGSGREGNGQPAPAEAAQSRPGFHQNAGGEPGPGGARGGGGGHPDEAGGAGSSSGLARVLQRSPEIHVGDLHKGDAVMIVATSGDPNEATAIRLVAGVEPMLRASASGSQSMFSSAWNLGGGSAQEGEEGSP